MAKRRSSDKRPMVFGSSFGSAAAEAAVGDLVARLRQVPQMSTDAAKAAAVELKALQDATIAAGQDAYGMPWTLTQQGKVPLTGAAGAVTITASGNQIHVDLAGIEVAHHIGWAKGYKGGTAMRRPIIPENRTASKGHAASGGKGLPRKWADKITQIVAGWLGIKLAA